MFKGVFFNDDVNADGNTDRTKEQNPFDYQHQYQQSHAHQLQIYLRAPYRAYSNYDDLIARTNCLTHWDYKPGLLPGIHIKRVTFEGNIHWAGSEQFEQQTSFLEAKVLLSPSVFLALVFDYGDADYFTPYSVGEPTVPLLRLSRAFDMHMSSFDELPYDVSSRPNPYPGPSQWPTEEERFRVIWHKTFIPSLEPSKTFENVSDIPYGEPPIGTLRTFRYLDRMAYFRGTVDVDLPIFFSGPQTPSEGINTTIYGSTGNLYLVAWQSGGTATNTTPQQVYLNWWSHVHHDLNKS